MNLEWPLPISTAKMIAEARPKGGSGEAKDMNLGLWLDRLLPRGIIERDEDPKKRWSIEGESRRGIARSYEGRWRSPSAREAMARQEEACAGLMNAGWAYERLTATLVTPAFLGPPGVADDALGLAFHPAWGAPRIAGSSLRGLAHAALAELGGDVVRIFGIATREVASSGRAIVLDAAPVDGYFELALEVQAPHFGPYYGSAGKKPPAEWWSPKPFTFLTLRSARFAIDILSKPHRGDRDEEVREIADTISGALKRVLEEHGIGGKTTAGYGRCGVAGRSSK